MNVWCPIKKRKNNYNNFAIIKISFTFAIPFGEKAIRVAYF